MAQPQISNKIMCPYYPYVLHMLGTCTVPQLNGTWAHKKVKDCSLTLVAMVFEWFLAVEWFLMATMEAGPDGLC